MPAPLPSLAALRGLLAERFPETTRRLGRVLPTGLAELDRPAGGGLPLGALTEIVCSAPSSGGSLLLAHLLGVTRKQRQRVALIDAIDSFDPASYPPDDLVHVVWIRCRHPAEALPAVDVLARDANFGLVVLDVRGAPEAVLRRIPATAWYRLQRAVEPTDLALVILTGRPQVPSVQLRLELSQPQPMEALQQPTAASIDRLAPALHRQRLGRIAATS